MDPLSLAAGVAGLVSLTGQTVNVTRAYVTEIKHGKEAATQMLQELDVLHFNLLRLDEFLKDEGKRGSYYDDTSVLVSSTRGWREKLTVLHAKLEERQQSTPWKLQSLVWPLKAKEHSEAVCGLQALTQWTHFSLMLNGSSLISKTSSEVLNILQQQVENSQLLHNLGNQTDEIQRTVNEQAQLLDDNARFHERMKVLDWVSKSNAEQKHHDVRVSRIEGTGGWLIKEPDFVRWQDRSASMRNLLWCYGMPGSGKTVLAYVCGLSKNL